MDRAAILPNRLAFEHSHSADAIGPNVRDARSAEAVEALRCEGVCNL
jgi:hypothetical protein